jgi:hypothetical protein
MLRMCALLTVACAIQACAKVEAEEGDSRTPIDSGTAPTGSTLPTDADADGSPLGEDCDDADPSAYPGAPELCDGLQNDCATPWDADWGVATFFPADGEQTEDLTATMRSGAPVVLPGSGTLRVCSGTYVTQLEVGGVVSILGDGSTTTILSGPGDGAVIAATPGAEVTLSGVTVTGGATSAASGAQGGVDCDGATVVVDDAVIRGNHGGYGGGLTAREGCSLTVRASVVEDNTAPVAGGALWVLDSDAIIEQTTVRGNASGFGAAIMVTAGAASLSSVVVVDNVVTGDGGLGAGVAVEEGVLTIEASELVGNANHAVDGDGGGLGCEASTVTVTDAVLDRNSAGEGGGIFAGEGCDVAVIRSDFSGNTAMFGGGISSVAALEVTESRFERNDALYAGGAIDHGFEGASLVLTDASFWYNVAGSQGGAVASSGSVLGVRVAFQSNHATEWGGALLIRGDAVFESSTFWGNRAQWGGAVDGGGTYLDTAFDANYAAFGGAISGDASVTECTFDANRAEADGGAVWGSVVAVGSTFTNNEAAGRGGALYLSSPSSVEASGFEGNDPEDVWFEEVGYRFDRTLDFLCADGVCG